jgi:hypothetical protein
MTKLYMLYMMLGGGVLGLYTTAAALGWEPGTLARETAQQSTARHAGGGHRSIWISSFRSGK